MKAYKTGHACATCNMHTSTKRKRKQNKSMEEVHGRFAACPCRRSGEPASRSRGGIVLCCRSMSTTRCGTAGSQPDDDACGANARRWPCLAEPQRWQRQGGAPPGCRRKRLLLHDCHTFLSSTHPSYDTPRRADAPRAPVLAALSCICHLFYVLSALRFSTRPG